MKKILQGLLLIISMMFSSWSFAQMMDPVKWSFSTKNLGNNEVELIFTAKVDNDWHLYSQTNPPNPLTFEFEENGKYKKIGTVKEPNPHQEDDEYLGPVAYFKSQTVVFTQKIQVHSDVSFEIKGNIFGQACQDNGLCVPIETNFLFKVSPEKSEGRIVEELKDTETVTNVSSPQEINNNEAEVSIGVVKFVPEKLTDEVVQKLDHSCGDVKSSETSKSIWGIFLAGFLGGFLALLTPCVFPIIPLTVSFFTKQSKSKAKGISNALIYAASIIIIYTGLGFLITKIAGDNALNDMASSAFWNLLFFIVFVIFAISFFGAFEIRLPSKFVNAMDAKSNKSGGLIGIFFMAFTLCLVTFSCTGPIIGTLLVEASMGGSNTGPLMGMFGFSLALALPFGLFAAFPGWLNTLPRSGSWMNTVKVSLGFLELALAMKFLSVVDLAYHWDFLYLERFLALWIVIFLAWALYLLGAVKLSLDDDKKPKLSAGRLILGIIVLGFSVYMIPGLFGAPLKLLSGLAPPSHYREWTTKTNECPHGIDCYHDVDDAVQVAKTNQKPLFIDFTGYACVNCRKMEDHVWSEPAVLKLLHEKFVVASLYVDDKTLLPENQQLPSLRNGKTLKTVGDKWKDFQTYYFNSNSQPQYIILHPNGKILSPSYSYDPDAAAFRAFLEQGLCRFKKM